MPSLNITAGDYAYIRAAVTKASPKEIGGLGVVVVEDGIPVIRHMRLLEQKISSSEVDWGDLGEAHAEYLVWLYTSVEDGGAGFDGDRYGIYSWHSHGNMGTFWSNTDEDFIKGVGTSVPWVFSSVYNNKYDSKHRLDVFASLSALGCELVEDDGRPQQISWKAEGACILNIIQERDVNPILDELEDMEDAAELAIAGLEEEFKASCAKIKEDLKKDTVDLRKLVADVHKDIRDESETRMKGDYDLYVTNVVSTHWTGRSNGNGTPPKQITRGNGSQTSSSTTEDGSASRGKGEGGASEPLSVAELKIALIKQYRAYDTVKKVHSFFKLSEMALCEDIVLIEEIHTDVLMALPNEIGLALAFRQTYDDYIAEQRGNFDRFDTYSPGRYS